MATQPISVFKPSYLFNPTELLTEKLTSYHNWKPNQRLNGSTQPTTEIMEIKLDYWHETHPAILRCYHSYWSLCQPDIYVHLYYVVNVESGTEMLYLCQLVLYVNLYYRAYVKIKKTMFWSLCQPDIYVHLYYGVNVEAETKMLCLRQPVLYVNLYYRANI